MPDYDYQCPTDKKIVTKFRPMADAEPDYFCEDCGDKLTRIYEAAAIQFKGTGFYKTGG